MTVDSIHTNQAALTALEGTTAVNRETGSVTRDSSQSYTDPAATNSTIRETDGITSDGPQSYTDPAELVTTYTADYTPTYNTNTYSDFTPVFYIIASLMLAYAGTWITCRFYNQRKKAARQKAEAERKWNPGTVHQKLLGGLDWNPAANQLTITRPDQIANTLEEIASLQPDTRQKLFNGLMQICHERADTVSQEQFVTHLALSSLLSSGEDFRPAQDLRDPEFLQAFAETWGVRYALGKPASSAAKVQSTANQASQLHI